MKTVTCIALLLASIICFPAHGVETLATIVRKSYESDQQFADRKERLTYGSPLNRKHCADFVAINVGLCKGGEASACFHRDMFAAWCVAPGKSADAAIAALPTLSREDYFYYGDGGWMSRRSYCDWLVSESLKSRSSARAARANFNNNCK